MNEPERGDINEANLGKLLAASVDKPSAHFEANLTRAVLAEVQAEQHRLRPRRRVGRRWFVAIAATAAAVIVLIALPRHVVRDGGDQTLARTVGEVTPIYGLVSLQDGAPERQLAAAESIRSGQVIETHLGSRAEIVLDDRSRLLVAPRTALQVDAGEQGQTVVLREGSVRVEAAKQQAGKSLTIETPGSHIRVLGTRFDVHLVQKSDGHRQTRVSVDAGRVELESAGQTVILLPNMEGIADEGRPPGSRSLTAEVNEMAHLAEMTSRLAAERHLREGAPAIVEFNGDASATVWMLLAIENKTTATLAQYPLGSRASASLTEAFSLEGASIPMGEKEGSRYLDLSSVTLSPGGRIRVVAKLTDVPGLFQHQEAGVFEFDRPADSPASLSLLQLRLPASASIEEVSPKPVETRETLSRLVITVAADCRMPGLLD
jgi:ferric-dicitrate binding protein FerR (iron transport regulator)